LEDAVNPDYEIPKFDGFIGVGALRLVNGLTSTVRRSVGGIARWRRRRAGIRELQALSDDYLKDIGLDRSRVASPVDQFIETGGHPAVWLVRGKQWGR
jgi:uncharacterized protein YjiS (DUF1127 family)